MGYSIIYVGNNQSHEKALDFYSRAQGWKLFRMSAQEMHFANCKIRLQ